MNMTIVEMLRKEANTIEDNSLYANFIRNDATDILISVKFADGTFHHILPSLSSTDAIVKELRKMVNPSYLERSNLNHLRTHMPEFVNAEEMEI